MKFNTYLNFPGQTEEAFKFYKAVFGGELVGATRFKDMAAHGIAVSKEDEDKMMHIGLPVGEGQMLMGTDALETMGHKLVAGNNVHISVHPDSKEDADRIFNALAEGGTVGMPIANQVWGDYYGHLTDKFGIHWMVNYSYPKAT